MNYSVNSLGFIILKASPKTLSLYNAVKRFFTFTEECLAEILRSKPQKNKFPW
jgi:hypothetical protein